MAYKDNNVTYGFGQMGSIHVAGTVATTPNGVAGMEKAVFCAITFLEDTVFHNSLAGLTPEDISLYPGGTGSTSAGIDVNGGAVTGGEVFPKGMTIYGRWTSLTLASGRVIAYIGY
tara:strand:- start:1024 stop:1371 length:348 start_codon:yes stop_codon:yes gene_type:complete